MIDVLPYKQQIPRLYVLVGGLCVVCVPFSRYFCCDECVSFMLDRVVPLGKGCHWFIPDILNHRRYVKTTVFGVK